MAREGRPTPAGPSPGLFRPVVGMTARPGAPCSLSGRWARRPAARSVDWSRGRNGLVARCAPVTDWDPGPIR